MRGPHTITVLGVLRHISSGRSIVLAAHNVAGRVYDAAVSLAAASASNAHASVRWTGDRWEVVDLGSLNGTFVDGTPVPLKETVRLTRGSIIRFGHDTEQWELTDDGEPSVLARSLETGDVRKAEDGVLGLPTSEDVQVSIFVDALGRWLVETSDGLRRPANNGEHLTVRGRIWELAVPPVSSVNRTEEEGPSPKIGTIALRFQVSRNEEHVRIEILHAGRSRSLGERAIFYLLLHLARERRNDAAGGELPEGDQGWCSVPELKKALNMDEGSLNIAVFRIRQAFSKAGVEGAEGILERRFREIRIGTARWEDVK